MISLDTPSFPLTGTSLIEASAGTGKTYTIVNLYLRLLLGHKCEARNVDQILVVTFTNAATAELKDRIRQRLNQAYIDFYQGKSADPLTQVLLDECDHIFALSKLALAAKQMDEASVFTIHGFCQRTLQQHAFESGALYEQSMLLDESEWLTLAVEDYWRTHILGLKQDFVEFSASPAMLTSILLLLRKEWPEPKVMASSLNSMLNRQVKPTQVVSRRVCAEAYSCLQNLVTQAKQYWLSEDLFNQFSDAGLKGNVVLGKSKTWQTMQTFCLSEELNVSALKDGWLTFTEEKVIKARKKGSHALTSYDFSIFEQVGEALNQWQMLVKQCFYQDALDYVAARLSWHKKRLSLVSPDDLLANLSQALRQPQNQALDNSIRQSYPCALIDEFQDTDPIQLSIFSRIYQQGQEHCLIMIGDPKQAIYGFRGADIYTYIAAKRTIPSDRHFTLDTNWRSDKSLVNAINCLFAKSEQGFLFDQDIPFYPVKGKRTYAPLIHNGEVQSSLQFHMIKGEDKPLPWSSVNERLAQHFAMQIYNYLHTDTQIGTEEKRKQVEAGDICVLVRDRAEAQLIKTALQTQGVDSVFLVRQNVFATDLAKDIYRLLDALFHPQLESKVKTALCSSLFALHAHEIDALLSSESEWQQLLWQFDKWHKLAQWQGVTNAVSAVDEQFSLQKKMRLDETNSMRNITNFRHIIEVLQQKSQVLNSQQALLSWLAEQIEQPDSQNDGQQLRLESDSKLVQIITQHASKGLEFPVVFIPFASRFKQTKQGIFHDKNDQLVVDYTQQTESMNSAERERLAEDLRLLYVALTRAVYHCSVGVWHTNLEGRSRNSGMLASALGRSLCKLDDKVSEQLIEERIAQLALESDIGLCRVDGQLTRPSEHYESSHTSPAMTVKSLSHPITRTWALTSYSAISQQKDEAHTPGLDEGHRPLLTTDESIEQTDIRFTFVKGAQAGTFLHGVLENIDFTQPDNLADVVEQQGTWYGMDEADFSAVSIWLKESLQVCFEQTSDLCLAAISNEHRVVEMEFYLPLVDVNAHAFNKVLSQFSPTRQFNYSFEQLRGMLKGFIDLTFCFENKYYVADYKSNYLGDGDEAYKQDQLEQAMQSHDYHLQGILYSLALHRYLQSRLPNYDYDLHIGGAYYLFLRGMKPQNAGNGCYFMRPEKALINTLDALFSGNEFDEECA